MVHGEPRGHKGDDPFDPREVVGAVAAGTAVAADRGKQAAGIWGPAGGTQSIAFKLFSFPYLHSMPSSAKKSIPTGTDKLVGNAQMAQRKDRWRWPPC